jgi:hypothetical protein
MLLYCLEHFRNSHILKDTSVPWHTLRNLQYIQDDYFHLYMSCRYINSVDLMTSHYKYTATQTRKHFSTSCM